MEKKETGLSALQESIHFEQADEASRRIAKTVTLPQAIAIAVVSVVTLVTIQSITSPARQLANENAALRRELATAKEEVAIMEGVSVALTERLLQASQMLGPAAQ